MKKINALSSPNFPPTPATDGFKSFLETWEKGLDGYYDKKWMMNILKNGAKVGVENPQQLVKTLSPNNFYMPMDSAQLEAITDWIIKLVKKGYLEGPFDRNFDFGYPIHTIPVFPVEKPELGKWRTVSDYSHTENEYESVNDHIPQKLKTIKYVTVREVVHMIITAGPEAHMFAKDVMDAYYRVPLDPSEYCLMGIKWCGKIWLLKVLPMGLASASRTFGRFGDGAEYVFVKNNQDIAFEDGVQLVRHYADDYFGVGKNKKHANELFQKLGITFRSLNIPDKPTKDIHPAPCIKLIGEIFECRVSGFLEQSWQRRCKALAYLLHLRRVGMGHKKQFEKLSGILNCICHSVWPGKAFLRRFQAIISDPRLEYNQWIRIDQLLLDDINWWIDLLIKPEGTRISFKNLMKKPDQGDHIVFTDASGTIGLGGVIDNEYAFQIEWKHTIYDKVLNERPEMDIIIQEYLGPIVVLEYFKDEFKNSTITFYNDNPGAAGALINKAPPLWRSDMHCLTRFMAKTAVEQHIMYWGIKIPGKQNIDADALSRFYTSVDWSEKGYKMIDVTNCVNKCLQLLLHCPKNRSRNYWKWTPQQKEILKIRQTQYIVENELTMKTKSKDMPLNYNILNKKSFD